MADLDKKLTSGDGSMSDDEVIFQTEEYCGIEKKVRPDEFYSYLELKKHDEFDNGQICFLISMFHYTHLQNIRVQLLKTCRASMIRGLVSLGIIAQAKQHNIMYKQINSLAKKYKDERTKAMNKRFQKSFNRIDFNDKDTKIKLPDIVQRYATKQYADVIWKSLYEIWEMPPLVLNDTRQNISPALLDSCRSMVRNKLSDKMYILKDSKTSNVDLKPILLKLTISDRFLIISHEFHKLFTSDKVGGQLFRGYLITGLYILSKWILQDRICEEEHRFNKLIDALDKLTSGY